MAKIQEPDLCKLLHMPKHAVESILRRFKFRGIQHCRMSILFWNNNVHHLRADSLEHTCYT
nr:MAG TPA: winged helix-turn-helix DNA-binding protein [Caudoviricetes sp.]